MTLSISYIAVPFVLGRKAKLVPQSPQTFSHRARAIRAAAGHGSIKAGAMVLEQRSDPDSDTVDEPRLIWHVGSIPDDMFQFAGPAG